MYRTHRCDVKLDRLIFIPVLCLHRVTLPLSPFNLQEEDLQEIIAKIVSKTAEYEERRAQMAELKAQYERAEQEYRQHKERINAAAEEADVKKVEPGILRP